MVGKGRGGSYLCSPNTMLGATLYNVDLVTNIRVSFPLIRSSQYSLARARIEDIKECNRSIIGRGSKPQKEKAKN